jgi:hypothetical protein
MAPTTKKPTAKRATKPSSKRTTKAASVTQPKVGDKRALDAATKAAAAARTAIVTRDAAIVKAVKGGTSARQVALATGLTHPGVLKIVKR